jgi:orotate phosphoribosyltransferase
MTLFRAGDFTLAGGRRSWWRIDCDALAADDWAVLARLAAERLPPFGDVEGVPLGGLPFAAALRPHATPDCSTLLIAEDVVTTGGSMERFREGRAALGVAAFCRGRCPPWVTPLFSLTEPAGDAP